MKVYERSDPEYEDQATDWEVFEYFTDNGGVFDSPLKIRMLAKGDLIVVDHKIGPSGNITALVIQDGDRQGAVTAMYLGGGFIREGDTCLPYPFQVDVTRIVKVNGLAAWIFVHEPEPSSSMFL